MRTPIELIQLYWDRVYNNMEVELVREICADPIIRHDPDFITPLSHDEQIVRVLRSAPMKPYFTHRVLHADDEFVTSVWDMVSRDGRDIKLCGIEVFRAENGRFTDCWNSPYMKGLWAKDDALFDPSVLNPPSLVSNPIEITAEWLERAFAAGGAIEAQRVATAPEIVLIGHGTTSTTVRIRVAYNSGVLTAPRTIIAKIGRQPRSLNSVSPFERERLAYELFGTVPAFRIPKLYFGASDETGLCNLLLEDLSGSAWAGDQITGCSITEAGAVIRELALFHRTYLGRATLTEADWLIQPTNLRDAYRRGASALRAWLPDEITAHEFAMVNALGANLDAWLKRSDGPRTLLHGDPRADNILFETVDGGIRACLIDWQSLGAGNPLYDVAYFLSGSMSVEDRRSCERDLLREYVQTLDATGRELNLEFAEASLRRNLAAGLWLTVISAAFVERTTHNAQLVGTLLHRNVAAMADWDTIAAIIP